jgi:hypothetical protein
MPARSQFQLTLTCGLLQPYGSMELNARIDVQVVRLWHANCGCCPIYMLVVQFKMRHLWLLEVSRALRTREAILHAPMPGPKTAQEETGLLTLHPDVTVRATALQAGSHGAWKFGLLSGSGIRYLCATSTTCSTM